MWYMSLYQIASLSMIYIGYKTIEEFHIFLGIYFIIVAIFTMTFHGIRMYKCMCSGVLPEDRPEADEEYTAALLTVRLKRLYCRYK